MTIAHTGLKFKVTGQSQGLGHRGRSDLDQEQFSSWTAALAGCSSANAVH